MHLITPTPALFLLFGMTITLATLVAARPSLAATHGGKILAFIALFVLPVLASVMTASYHLEHSKQTKFCLSCHIMEPYGRSLYVDDPGHVPAAHFQNARIPRDEACFTCHTTYTMYGDMHAKLQGLRHVYVNYFGTPPAPEKLKLYDPYNNRECLHCHSGARSFEENQVHGSLMAEIISNRFSCISSGCHDTVHDVGGLGRVKYWRDGK